jgi:hypothetical protein
MGAARMDVKIDDISRQYHDLQQRYREGAPGVADTPTLFQNEQSLVEKRADDLSREFQQPDLSPGPTPNRLLRIFSGDLIQVTSAPISVSFTVPVMPEYWALRLVGVVAPLATYVTIEQQGSDYITLFIPAAPTAPDWFPVPGLSQNLKLTLSGASGNDVNYVVYACAGYDWFNFRSGGWGAR